MHGRIRNDLKYALLQFLAVVIRHLSFVGCLRWLVASKQLKTITEGGRKQSDAASDRLSRGRMRILPPSSLNSLLSHDPDNGRSM